LLPPAVIAVTPERVIAKEPLTIAKLFGLPLASDSPNKGQFELCHSFLPTAQPRKKAATIDKVVIIFFYLSNAESWW
jgi:hypothetical protein